MKKHRRTQENRKKPINRKHMNPLKTYRKNTNKQVKKLNRRVQDLKMEIETIKKSKERHLWIWKT